MLWDDGEYEDYQNSFALSIGEFVAIGFDAPSWVHTVVGADVYVTPHPGGRLRAAASDTASAFVVHVWRCSRNPPLMPLNVKGSVAVPSGQPVDSWVSVRFAEPVGIVDIYEFRFFIGVEWLSNGSPAVGLDEDAPSSGWTRLGGGEWTEFGQGDAMIRAVVSDDLDPAVEASTWAAIKSLYR